MAWQSWSCWQGWQGEPSSGLQEFEGTRPLLMRGELWQQQHKSKCQGSTAVLVRIQSVTVLLTLQPADEIFIEGFLTNIFVSRLVEENV